MDTWAIGAVLAALGLSGAAFFTVMKDRGRFGAIPRDGGIYESVRTLDEDLANIEAAVAHLQPQVRSLMDRMPGALRYAAVVTFDATEERLGHQSRAIALLNERSDGLVITLLVGPRQTLFFTKMVRGGKGVEPLSPEEQTSVDRARGGNKS
jgi:hypothetical protein